MDVLDKEMQLEKMQYDVQKDKEDQLYRQQLKVQQRQSIAKSNEELKQFKQQKELFEKHKDQQYFEREGQLANERDF
jgi:hypothetical protein